MRTMRAFAALSVAMGLAAAGCAGPAAPGPADAVHDASVTGTYWRLVELHGRPVPALEREPHLVLEAEGGRVNGAGGCNRLSGTYEIDEAAARIRVGPVAATRMACAAGMDVERAFLDVLSGADSYSLDGDRMTLNRARMAPLARFRAVHLR